MRKRISQAVAAILVFTGAAVFEWSSPASAALPRCTSYQRLGIGDTGFAIQARTPSAGFDGSNDCVLRLGDSNDAVRVLQYLIACNGHYLLPDGREVTRDGVFGAITQEGLRLVQRDKGIAVDGVYGPQTREASLRPVFNGDSGWWFYDCY